MPLCFSSIVLLCQTSLSKTLFAVAFCVFCSPHLAASLVAFVFVFRFLQKGNPKKNRSIERCTGKEQAKDRGRCCK